MLFEFIEVSQWSDGNIRDCYPGEQFLDFLGHIWNGWAIVKTNYGLLALLKCYDGGVAIFLANLHNLEVTQGNQVAENQCLHLVSLYLNYRLLCFFIYQIDCLINIYPVSLLFTIVVF